MTSSNTMPQGQCQGRTPGAGTNERARALAWVFVHRHEMYVAGTPAQAPHYRFVCQVPEPQCNDERRAAVTAAMTQAVVEAEDGAWPEPERRVWVFTHEVKDGSWGAFGRILRITDIAQIVFGDKGPELAEQVLAAAGDRKPSCFSPPPASEPSRERPRSLPALRRRGVRQAEWGMHPSERSSKCQLGSRRTIPNR